MASLELVTRGFWFGIMSTSREYLKTDGCLHLFCFSIIRDMQEAGHDVQCMFESSFIEN